MIWHYNLRILFEEVCKFPFSLTVAREKDSKNILERLVYEKKYKIMYYTIVDGVAYQGWSNCSFLLNDVLGVTNLHYCSCVPCLMIVLQFKGTAFISCI